jgi:hypothetical protein
LRLDLRVVRLADGKLEVNPRGGKVTGSRQRVAAAVMGFHQVRRELERTREIGNCSFEFAAVIADDASIAVRHCVVWLEGDGGIEIRQGAIEVAQAMVGGGPVVVGQRERRLESDGGVVVGDGALEVTTLIVGRGPIVKNEGPIRVAPQHLAVIVDRLLEVTSSLVRERPGVGCQGVGGPNVRRASKR